MTKKTLIISRLRENSRPFGKFADASVLLIAAALMTLVSCDRQEAPHNEDTPVEMKQQNLLNGYTLLADALAAESRLDTLDFFKKLTLNSPNEAIENMMMTLSDAAERHVSELRRLRALSPDVSDDPATNSPIGAAIQSNATKKGKSEMTDRRGGFDIRFVLLQAQATRMIAVMATSIASFDANKERRAWLKDIADEYEGYRIVLIKYLDAGKCPPPQ